MPTWSLIVSLAAALLVFGLSAGEGAPAPRDWKDLRTVSDVCQAKPTMVEALFAALDLERKELAEVKAAHAAGDLVKASELLLAYYREGNTSAWLRKAVAPPSEKKNEAAEAYLQDTYTFYGESMKIPRRKDGGLDWNCDGPRHDVQWRMALNRHAHIGHLVSAYRETGNRAYAKALDEQFRDWTCAIAFPTRAKDAWGSNLDVSFRGKAWSAAFFGLQQEEAFSSAARLLLLTRLPEHIERLQHYKRGSNWATMELSGLASIVTAFPEFRGADAAMHLALRGMTSELKGQVYPDGVQKELTSHYHWVSLNNFNQFATICRDAGIELPKEYREGLEQMYSYLAYTMRPNGRGLLNNDSDLNDNTKVLEKARDAFQRDDWTYIATNGKEGKVPEGLPSVVYPWAGQVIMRSGWDAQAQWAFFDIGPYGSGHQHADMLHLSVHAGGRDLLVDTGRFAYQGNLSPYLSQYARTSRAHNVVLINGQGQGRGVPTASKPLEADTYALLPELDFAMGSFGAFEKGAEKVTHTRAVVYLRGRFWIVIDRIATDEPLKLEALWHFHPHCTVAVEGETVRTTDEGQGNLRVVPIGGPKWTCQLIKGQNKPVMQGWYSVKYGEKEACVTASFTAEAEPQDGATTFAWLLVPGPDKVPAGSGKLLASPAGTVRLQVDSPEKVDLAVRLAGGALLQVGGQKDIDARAAVAIGDGPPMLVHEKKEER